MAELEQPRLRGLAWHYLTHSIRCPIATRSNASGWLPSRLGWLQAEAVLDLDYVEDSSAETDMNVVMLESGGFIEVQGTAEGAPFSRSGLDELLDLAGKGVGELIELQKGRGAAAKLSRVVAQCVLEAR